MGPRIAIAGGGLGGLSAALFLLRAGVRDVRVFEQQSELAEIGAGIQVAPNAVRLLQRLGVRAAGADGRRGAVRGRVGVPPLGGRGGCCSSQSFRRGGRGPVRRAVPRTGRTCSTCWRAAVPSGVVVLGASRGRRCPAGASRSRSPMGRRRGLTPVIGADGIHSVVRDPRRRPGRPGVHRPGRVPRAGTGGRRRSSSPAGRSARSGSARAGTSSTTRSARAAR